MRIISFLILTTFFSLSLAGCTVMAVGSGIPEPVDPAEGVSGNVTEDICAQPSAGQQQFSALGVCFLYPDNYQVDQSGSNLVLYVNSPLNTEAPLLSVDIRAADGHSLEDIVAESMANYGLPAEQQPTQIVLGGEEAFVLDNLPGQDINRRVVAIYNDRVYDLIVARIGPDYGEVGQQAEELYELVIGTLQFTTLEPGETGSR